jgi:hypothetical protein
VTAGDSRNYGIVGDVAATNLVVGSHGHIDARGATQLIAGMEQLERAVAAHDGPPETRSQLVATVREVAAELERPQPDKGSIVERLETIGTVAGVGSAVAGAATTLVSLIASVL